MIAQRPAAACPPTPMAAPASRIEDTPDRTPFPQSLTWPRGDSFAGPHGLEIAIVESGVVSLEVTTAAGLALCLHRLVPGDVVVPLDRLASPAFTLAYRSDETARVTSLPAATASRIVEAERTILRATTDLLAACVRMIHELACLPAPHRLYCELLRMAAREARGAALGPFVMPGHAVLAARLCTTRETISRELSFLRRNQVLSTGKSARLLKPDFLVDRIAGALNLTAAKAVWEAIGAARG